MQREHLLDQRHHACVAHRIGGVGEVDGADGHSEEGIQNGEPLFDDQLMLHILAVQHFTTASTRSRNDEAVPIRKRMPLA